MCQNRNFLDCCLRHSFCGDPTQLQHIWDLYGRGCLEYILILPYLPPKWAKRGFMLNSPSCSNPVHWHMIFENQRLLESRRFARLILELVTRRTCEQPLLFNPAYCTVVSVRDLNGGDLPHIVVLPTIHACIQCAKREFFNGLYCLYKSHTVTVITCSPGHAEGLHLVMVFRWYIPPSHVFTWC